MRAILLLALSFPFAASAAGLDCSIKAKKSTGKADMVAMAKVKDDNARKTAIEAVGAGAWIIKGGIEVEHGCLVYAYDIRVPKKAGVQEVVVDAGTGKVLAIENEGGATPAVEKTTDKK